MTNLEKLVIQFDYLSEQIANTEKKIGKIIGPMVKKSDTIEELFKILNKTPEGWVGRHYIYSKIYKLSEKNENFR